MVKFFFLSLIVVATWGCKEQNGQVANTVATFGLNTEKWPKKAKVEAKALDTLQTWSAFMTFDTTFDALYGVANTEDLHLVIEDLVEQQKQLESSAFPNIYNKPQVKSRLKVFQTYLLKTKGHIEYRLDPQEPVLEMINTYNSLLGQLNIISNNTLDIKALLEEN